MRTVALFLCMFLTGADLPAKDMRDCEGTDMKVFKLCYVGDM